MLSDKRTGDIGYQFTFGQSCFEIMLHYDIKSHAVLSYCNFHKVDSTHFITILPATSLFCQKCITTAVIRRRIAWLLTTAMVWCRETAGTALTITNHCVPCVFRNRLVCFHTRIWRLTTCSLLGALTCTTFFLFHGYMEDLMQWLTDTNDLLCFLLFIALFMIFSLPIVVPGYIFLNMAAGFRFGLILGTTVVVICVGIGSTLAFFDM